jgi:hypothetical protein
MNITYAFFAAMLLILGSLQATAQKNIEKQDLLWTRYALRLKVDDHWTVRQELENRTYWFPWRQHQFVTRTMADRKLGMGWNAGLGMAFFNHSLPNDPRLEISENQSEFRPQLELAYRQDISDKVSLSHRYWSEFRFLEQSNGGFIMENNRSRYKLEIRYQPTDRLSFQFYDEILINIGGKIVQNVFDQNRYGASVQYMALKTIGFELGYFNWFQQRRSGIDFYDRNIIRFTVHHQINLQNSKRK